MYTGVVRKCETVHAVHLKNILIRECIASQCYIWPVAIYSNMTHFNVGNNDEVSVRSNGDIDDIKLTRS